MQRICFSILLFAGLLIAGCDSNGPDDSEPLEATVVADVAADPAGARDPETGVAASTGRYTLYSLRENRIVLNYDETNRADSATTQWDIGFRSTNIIVNGGASGPGEGGAQIVTGLFEELIEAPAADYEVDADGELALGAWYNYSGPPNHLITPVPGRVLVIRTANGDYAKVRILHYYKGSPTELPADGTEHPSRYYTFEYVYQPDGSRNLQVED